MTEVINGQRADVHHGVNLSTTLPSTIDSKPSTGAALLKSAEHAVAFSTAQRGAVPHWLQASPYSDADHLLDLGTLALPDQLLAIALTKMAPLDAEYATTEYNRAFNWDTVVEELRNLTSIANYAWRRSEYYVVVFRSQLNEGCDRAFLGQLDKNSHREAVVSGGLLKYWFGTPNGVRRNLATCECTPLFVRRRKQRLMTARHLALSRRRRSGRPRAGTSAGVAERETPLRLDPAVEAATGVGRRAGVVFLPRGEPIAFTRHSQKCI
jgi:hypothetical protein